MHRYAVEPAVNLPDETGYLACTKILKGRRKPRVLLVADEMSSGKQEFAAYVGATDCLGAKIGPLRHRHVMIVKGDSGVDQCNS